MTREQRGSGWRVCAAWRLLVGAAVAAWLVAAVLASPAAAAGDELNVFILAHSHCDPGWLNTFEGYFQRDVNAILSNVVTALQQDARRRFIWAEISFFSRWYSRQSEETRQTVEDLVASGQLEFVEGGWVQADEADTNYVSIMNHIAEGHAYLKAHFGVRPRFAYQIDPFGHSSATPSLFARMGFEGLVINRIHHALKSSFKRSKHMEFVWRGAPETLGPESDLLTHVLHTHYSAPKGFDFEEHSMPISPSNVASRATVLVRELRSRSAAYATSNLLVPFGDDFKFKRAQYQFTNMEQLIEHINANEEGVNIRFATLSDYFDAMIAEAASAQDVTLPLYEADFFPYADNEDSYWTGYYTTRPVLKQLARATEAHLRGAEILYTLARTRTGHLRSAPTFWSKGMAALVDARRQTALVQHHDGITGTAKQHVVADYSTRLLAAHKGLTELQAALLPLLLASQDSLAAAAEVGELAAAAGLRDAVASDRVLDVEALDGNAGYVVVVSSSLAWPTSRLVKVMVTSSKVRVTDASGEALTIQVVPHWDDAHYAPSPHAGVGGTRPATGAGASEVFETEPAPARYALHFEAELGPLESRTFKVHRDVRSALAATTVDVYSGALQGKADAEEGVDGIVYHSAIPGQLTLTGTRTSVVLEDGLVASIAHDGEEAMEARQAFVQYASTRSGAYIFRAQSEGVKMSVASEAHAVRLVRGPLFESAKVVRGAIAFEVSVRASVGAGERLEGLMVELDVSVVAAPDNEVSLRFETAVASGETFYSDSGLQVMKRVRVASKPIHTNVYPCLATALVRDEKRAFAVLSTQPRGVTSLASGEIEVFLHRQLMQDDGRGLAEPPRDAARYASVMWLYAGSADGVEARRRQAAHMLEHPPLVFASTRGFGDGEWEAVFTLAAQGMAAPLETPAHLLTLKSMTATADDVLIQVSSLAEDNRQTPIPPLDKLLALDGQPVKVSALRPALLAGDEDRGTRRAIGSLLHLERDDFDVQAKLAAGGDGPGASQNTDEAGVFISQAALDDLAKAGAQRRLLEVGASEPELKLGPLAIKSFLVHLEPSEAVVAGRQQQGDR
ncbi:alpha-mannosidase 2 [Thecamonas trahens ATCC 50062]|uniref:Alpha-mannosidase n=1 Tax=Thecamonas trahens ATCC 50062 TaxID=461836 RepID=A0A0L0DWA8_THETB|nr:alpha-mannosidase 2 [Thecamonas trahens ATCC 50062]KNC56371.1 alpha-mannosidase 2 [Thecamonas trahens ATCC 50062]|eukprot:XP_013760886.1 alpha-mannosidase 2 [Thecamonas trahens ATCC 50062]